MAGKISNAVAKKNTNIVDKPKSLKDYIKNMEGEIAKALPSVVTPERFTRIVLSAISSNPKLAECSPSSFLGAMMTAAQLGVEPNTPLGQAYLIPYNNSKKRIIECQFQLGYKGLIDLAYRSGQVNYIQAHTVYENDEFEYSLGLDPVLKHTPAKSNRGKPEYFYAVFKTKDGGHGFEVMSYEDVLNHARRYSKSFGDGPWKTNFEEMAKKTVLKRVLKYAPLKTDFVRAVSADESIRQVDTKSVSSGYSVDAFEDAKFETVVEADFSISEETKEDDFMTDEEKEEIRAAEIAEYEASLNEE